MIDIPSYNYHRGELMVWDDYREYKSMTNFLSVCVRNLLSYTPRKYHTKLVDVGGLFQNPGILMDDFVNHLKNKIFSIYLLARACSRYGSF